MRDIVTVLRNPLTDLVFNLTVKYENISANYMIVYFRLTYKHNLPCLSAVLYYIIYEMYLKKDTPSKNLCICHYVLQTMAHIDHSGGGQIIDNSILVKIRDCKTY